MNETFIPDQALVVGGTRGIGRALAARLAGRGVDVTIVGRSPSGDETAEAIGARFVRADVGEPGDLRALVDHVRSHLTDLDLMVHSADVLASKRSDTSDGLELSFAVNHRSRVWLNEALIDRLTENAPSRIVHVAAAGLPGRLDLGEIPPGPETSAMAAHAVGQRANDVYGVDLARRLEGTGVSVLVTNPGMVDTGIRTAGIDPGPMRSAMRFMETLARPFMPDADTYAERLADLITRPADQLEGTLYGPRFKPARMRDHVLDPDIRAELLARSLELVSTANAASGGADEG